MRKRSLNSFQISMRSPLPQAVRGLVRLRRRVDEVAAELADILEDGALVAHDVVPELARGELFADHHGAAVDEHGAGRDHAAARVVHRQAVVHAVGGLRVHHACKAERRQQEPVVVDVRRLRHAGGAGRIDEERAVLDGERPAFLGGERIDRQRLDFPVDARQGGRAFAVHPDLRPLLQMRLGGRKGRAELRRDDDVLRVDHVDAMGERGAGEIGVEQRHHAADCGDADPDGEIFRPVRHQERDDFALGEAVVERPARITIGALGEPGIAEPLAVAHEGRLVEVLLGQFLDQQGKDAGRILCDRRRVLERAQRAVEKDHVVLEAVEEVHGPRAPAVRDRRSVPRI